MLKLKPLDESGGLTSVLNLPKQAFKAAEPFTNERKAHGDGGLIGSTSF